MTKLPARLDDEPAVFEVDPRSGITHIIYLGANQNFCGAPGLGHGASHEEPYTPVCVECMKVLLRVLKEETWQSLEYSEMTSGR